MLFNSAAVFPSDRQAVTLANGNELDIVKYPAAGDDLLLWLPSEHGLTSGLDEIAKALSTNGTETWVADPFSTWFLATAPSSLDRIDIADYQQLIDQAMLTGKKVFLASNDRGTSLLLETAYNWQAGKEATRLGGAVIISPNLYTETPGSGKEAEYLPVVASTSLPLLLIVPRKSTGFLRIMESQEALARGGSIVYIQPLPGVRDRFFFRNDAVDIEIKTAAQLPRHIQKGISLLDKTPHHVSAGKQRARIKNKKPGQPGTGKLLPFRGSWAPPPFTLLDLAGKSHSLQQYRDKVVLVNFWASWCPPCIHEIPSMTQLQKAYSGNDFDILALNLGEDREAIDNFLIQHPVNFTVLLDPGQSQPRMWKVFAFPTSYLLGKDGRIRYSVAGAIDWNSSEVKEAIDSLLSE
jgi:thiol-disulfide isomerase/thioredoxin